MFSRYLSLRSERSSQSAGQSIYSDHRSAPCSSITNFLLKFSILHFALLWPETNFTHTVKLADPENPLIGARDRIQEHISHRSPVIASFLLKFSNFRYRGNGGCCETNFTYTVKFADPENPVWCNNRGHIFYKLSYRKFCV